MGLKQDLINAKVKAAEESGVESPIDVSDGSFIEREAEYVKEAIVNFLTQAELRITQLNAQVILEDFKIPPQRGDVVDGGVQVQGVGNAGAPVVSTIPIGSQGGKNGVLVNEIDVNKFGGVDKTGNLIATGYSFIGRDPDSQDGFFIDDVAGQQEFTTVKLFREDIEELL